MKRTNRAITPGFILIELNLPSVDTPLEHPGIVAKKSEKINK